MAFDSIRLWVLGAKGYGLLGYETPDAFYRDVREGNLPSHYYERRGKRIFISMRALGLVPPAGESPKAEIINEPHPASAAAQK